MPYQLSIIPNDRHLEAMKQRGKEKEAIKLHDMLRKCQLSQDQPDDANEYVIQLELGDIFVSATDGVFDNLFKSEINAIVKTYKEEQYEDAPAKARNETREDDHLLPCMLHTQEQAEELATRIVKAARAKVDAGKKNQCVITPYGCKYKKTYNAAWDGGK